MCLFDHILANATGTEVPSVTSGPRPKALETHNYTCLLVSWTWMYLKPSFDGADEDTPQGMPERKAMKLTGCEWQKRVEQPPVNLERCLEERQEILFLDLVLVRSYGNSSFAFLFCYKHEKPEEHQFCFWLVRSPIHFSEFECGFGEEKL